MDLHKKEFVLCVINNELLREGKIMECDQTPLPLIQESGEQMIPCNKEIKSKADFLAFLTLYNQDLKSCPEEWANRDLPSFLDALKEWIEDMEQYYINTKQEVPLDISWKVLSDMLMAARVYE